MGSGLGCANLTVKYLVFIFNMVFCISGLMLTIIGGIAEGFFKDYIQFFDNDFKSPGTGLIILGGIIMIVSFFGCCGAKMDNVCMLKFFSFLLIVLLACEVTAGILAAVMKFELRDALFDGMEKSMKNYNNGTLPGQTWDRMQADVKCCGTSGYQDWSNVTWSEGSNVPDTCCKTVTEGCGSNVLNDPTLATKIYENGCGESLMTLAGRNLGLIIGVAVGVAIIEIIGIWMSCCLIKFVGQNYEAL